MARYETYQSNAAEAPLMRKWVIRALLISLALHAALFVTFNLKKLENFGVPDVTAPAAIPVNMKRPVIPMIDEKESRAELPKTPNLAPLHLPSEKPELTEVRVAPQISELSKPLGVEKPKADPTGGDALAKAESASRGQLDRELNSLAGSLIRESVRAPRQPAIRVPGGQPGEGGAEGIPGLSTISDLLGQTGSLKSGVRGGIPGGALYEHGSAELKEAAMAQLQQLGELIRRNPSATFIIEGHTDSTGTPEINQTLSEERANSVKDWLVANMGIAPGRIETLGLGSSKMIVSPQAVDAQQPGAFDAEVARQRPNRRVEIVIRTNRK